MIEVKNLSKNYGNFEAVKDISFSVDKAEVLGFLGPNGAGKTTVMKMLTGYHFPNSGEIIIDGISVPDEPVEIKKKIGYLPESNPLYGELSPDEYLYFMASSRLIPGKNRRLSVDLAITACGLEGHRKQRIDSLSKGYRQRVGLAQAIIHDPEILILDEPTSGLDPNQIIEIRSLIRELGKSKTVILSTHILQEVEAVSQRVLILNEGRIAAQGTSGEIAASLKGGGRNIWELLLKGAKEKELKKSILLLGAETTGLSIEKLQNGIIALNFAIPGSRSNDGECIFDWAVKEGYKIIGMKQKKLSLEDIFVKLTNVPLSKEEKSNE